jgi:hypothetical protein
MVQFPSDWFSFSGEPSLTAAQQKYFVQILTVRTTDVLHAYLVTATAFASHKTDSLWISRQEHVTCTIRGSHSSYDGILNHVLVHTYHLYNGPRLSFIFPRYPSSVCIFFCFSSSISYQRRLLPSRATPRPPSLLVPLFLEQPNAAICLRKALRYTRFSVILQHHLLTKNLLRLPYYILDAQRYLRLQCLPPRKHSTVTFEIEVWR